jgi:hypothetical protein
MDKKPSGRSQSMVKRNTTISNRTSYSRSAMAQAASRRQTTKEGMLHAHNEKHELMNLRSKTSLNLARIDVEDLAELRKRFDPDDINNLNGAKHFVIPTKMVTKVNKSIVKCQRDFTLN